MSIEAMNWALGQPVGGTKKLVLIGIASHADRYGDNAWPSISTLAYYAHVDERSVQRAIADLTSDGYVHRDINQGGTLKMSSHTRPNLYQLNIEGKPPKPLPRELSAKINPVTPVSPPDASVTPPPDASVTPPVTPVSPKPYKEPSKEPSIGGRRAQAPAPAFPKLDSFDAEQAEAERQAAGKVQAKPAKPTKAAEPAIACPADVPAGVFADFLAIRKAKRAPLTATALAGIGREAAKAGISLADALAVCCERGWVGFRADWYGEGSATSQAARPGRATAAPAETFRERDERLARERWEQATGQRHPDSIAAEQRRGNVIDVTPRTTTHAIPF